MDRGPLGRRVFIPKATVNPSNAEFISLAYVTHTDKDTPSSLGFVSICSPSSSTVPYVSSKALTTLEKNKSS